MNTPSESLPKIPVFTDELVDECKKSRDFRPMLFEWYKHIGLVCITVASINPNSPALRKIPPVHYAVLVGLLNRCSRLMLANIRLSSTRKYGETTVLIDRSIEESAIKIQWLCAEDGSTNRFVQYLADGLKKDLILKDHIQKNIEKRKGEILVIERRMLKSIENCITLSGLSEQDIREAKRLPSLDKMLEDIDIAEGFYIGVQRMGSHAVHGTWSELIFHYLHHDDEQGFYLRDHEVDTQDAQFVVVARLVIEAMIRFLSYTIPDQSDAIDFITALNNADEKILELQRLAWAPDFDKI